MCDQKIGEYLLLKVRDDMAFAVVGGSGQRRRERVIVIMTEHKNGCRTSRTGTLMQITL